METTPHASTKQQPRDSADYDALLRGISETFANRGGDGRPLFTTDVDAGALWAMYLDNLPPEERQHHTCSACKHFVRRFGGLVTINEDGEQQSVMWRLGVGIYAEAFAGMERLVRRARVTGVFLSSDATWGQPVTGPWRHMAVRPFHVHARRHATGKTAGQAMAEKREEYGMLQRGIAEIAPNVVAEALAIVEGDALYRVEKVQAPVKWFHDLLTARNDATPGRARDNLTWLAVAKAPPGFTHVRTTMAATLYEDIAARMPIADVRKRFADKMSPLLYQRPQAPPSEGNVKVAEEVMAKLGAAGALRRRFARPDEIEAIWRPAAPASIPPSGGVFDAVRTRSETERPSPYVPASEMTLAKFRAEVMPRATRIRYEVRPLALPLISLVTAEDMSAPPLLQWDTEEKRNPFSWYVYHGGSPASRFGLKVGQMVDVVALALLPPMWGDGKHEHQGAGVVAVLAGCRDLENRSSGLFPELLRSEYREAKRTIEAYSKVTPLVEHPNDPAACGLDLRKGGGMNHSFEVTVDGRVRHVCIDRWD